MKYFGGNGGDYAEIVIDYQNKKVKIIDPITKKHFRINYFPSIADFLITTAVFILFNIFFTINNNLYLFFTIFIITWVLSFSLPSFKNYYHLVLQKISNDYFLTSKFTIVKDIKTKEYHLPYEFYNNKLNYKCYKDYGKYLIKIHIFPKDYYYKWRNNKEKQTDEWEAVFYFKKIPKEGRLEIEWI